MSDRGTLIFRVSLQGQPSINRELEILSNKSLWELAKGIVRAFDFDFDHAFGFYSGRSERTLMSTKPKYELFADMGEESDASSVKKTKVAEAFSRVGRSMTFLFDYGDEWLFQVELIGEGQVLPKARYPRVLRAEGPSPEQYPDYDDD